MACRLGAVDSVLEALDEGAEINFAGGSPLFTAIMAGERAVVEMLVEKGADLSIFEIDETDRDQVIEELMKLAPAPEEDPGDDGVDGKLVRAFDRMIRNKGFNEPFKKKRADEFPAFCEGLKWIAAEECHAIVKEFLDMVELVRKEAGEDALPEFLESNAPRIAELSERYASVDEIPGELLKEYLKERKKVA